jgi:hypothetical protein
MNKTARTISIIVVAVAFLMSYAIIPANACNTPSTRPKYDLTGTWAFNDISGATSYPHTMMINSFNPVTGAFSGIGYYVADPTLTWTITGTEVGNVISAINFVLTVNTPPVDSGITLLGTGTAISGTSMSGTGTQSNVGAVTWTATKGAKVLDVSALVTNDEDSGIVGYWALDSYCKTVQVWQDPNVPTNFYAIVTYNGAWQTFKGALSPQAGVLETKNAAGCMQGGYFASFTANSVTSKFGYAGTFNNGGTKADILLGKYGAGQTGGSPTFDWTSKYFTGFANFNYINWGWTYSYGCGKQSQTWVNSASGNTGDIVV